MLIFLRFIGWILIFVALAALGIALWDLAMTGSFTFATWGELWYRINPGSLNLYQAVVERYLSPELWDKVLAPLLLEEAFFVFALPGLFLASLGGIIHLFRRVFGKA